ncbi:MAG: hypothetical protein JNK87_07270 [Bryobacterales bacterium]|nr:hypothetical protein [Bryobacterales bacterium]
MRFIWIPALLVMSSHSSTSLDVSYQIGRAGLTSLQFEGYDYLADGVPRINAVSVRSVSGKPVDVPPPAPFRTNWLTRTATAEATWGTISLTYRGSAERLLVTVEVTNRSPHVIDALWLELMQLRFPSRPTEYDSVTPLLSHGNGQPALVAIRHALGRFALVSEDPAGDVLIGLPWATDRPAGTVFPVSLNTGRVPAFPDSTPTIVRPIAPGATDRFTVSLRFAGIGGPAKDLTGDVYDRFSKRNPPAPGWSDRRPIGALFLSTAAAGWPKNPRGWLQDAQIDTTTKAGIGQLKRRVLGYADASVAILKATGAQGMITWDIEGQQFPHPISYIGDPRRFFELAPEMAEIADEYFRRFRDAGLRTGVCIRPQRLQLSADGSARQEQSPDPASVLNEKVRWVRNRWDVSLVYIDSNITAHHFQPLDASIVRGLAQAFPDILFIPEHASLAYYGFSAPYQELRKGVTAAPSLARLLYPTAFSVIYIADGNLERRYQQVRDGVKRGDVLLFRAWYDDPANRLVKRIYSEQTNP